jgi:hypothetical protein
MGYEGNENVISKEQVIHSLSIGRNEEIPTQEDPLYLSWIKQQEQLAESDPTGDARIMLSINTAEVLFQAGYIEEAKDTLEDVENQLQGQGGDKVINEYWRIYDVVYEK